jgi:hypothetical protein
MCMLMPMVVVVAVIVIVIMLVCFGHGRAIFRLLRSYSRFKELDVVVRFLSELVDLGCQQIDRLQ